MSRMIRFLKVFLKFARYCCITFGIVLLLAIAFAFTSGPFWLYYWLGTSKSQFTTEPESIVLLGGSGMPGKSNLIRCWYTGKAAAAFPATPVLIAMPGDTCDSLSTPRRMEEELLLRNVQQECILFENEGTNTRAQALYCSKIIDPSRTVLIVTSPEHMRRAVLAFQKAGFENVQALPAFENDIEADLSFDDDLLGKESLIVPDVGESISLRYQLWNHLTYEIMVARELAALAYYKLRGWI